MKRCFFLLLLCGCSFFSKTKSQIYSLERIPGAAVAAAGAPVGIDSIELPPGFDRKEIVVRKANNQLDVRGTQQWAAPLTDLVTHALAFDLASRLPEGMVVLPGQAKPTGTMRPIFVVFEELAAGRDMQFTLDAHWTVGTTTHHEHIAIPMPWLESANVARGMSQALAQLADRIAAGV